MRHIKTQWQRLRELVMPLLGPPVVDLALEQVNNVWMSGDALVSTFKAYGLAPNY